MKTRLFATASAVVAAALAVAAVSLLPPRTGARTPAPSLTTTARPVVVRASFEPSAVEFGDLVTARVVVTLDTHVVRQSTTHFVYDIAPLTQLGRATLKRAPLNDPARSLRVLSYEVRAACLSDACLSASGRRAVSPGPVHVDVARQGQGGRVSAGAAWAPLTVAGRVTQADLAPSAPPFRVSTALPPTTYPISPGTLAALFGGAAALLAACGAGLAVSAVFRTRRAAPDERPNELARALLLIRAARARPEPDRRSALGYVARLLNRRDAPLASAADTLAWSRPAPTPDSLTELASELERELPS